MKNIINPSYCQKCGVFGEHHSYMLNKNWEGLCNDCAFHAHWRDIGDLCDQLTKEAQETVEETKCRSCGVSFKQDSLGKFVVLEGADLSGKSTQVAMLKEEFGNDDQYVFVADPGSTKLGAELRKILKTGLDGEELDPMVELLLFTAVRQQLLATIIIPALNEGKTVICDRYLPSTIVYQGYGNGMPIERIMAMHKDICKGIQPDITIVLDIPLAEHKARQRLRGGGDKDRFETRGEAYTKRILDGYAGLYQLEEWDEEAEEFVSVFPDIIQLDGMQSKEELNEVINKLLQNNSLNKINCLTKRQPGKEK